MNERGPYPPEWIDEAHRTDTDPSRFQGTPAGDTRLTLWRSLGPVTELEFAWAMHPARPLEQLPPAMFAVERVQALRASRERFSTVSDSAWAELIRKMMPALPASAMTDVNVLVQRIERYITAAAEIAAVRKPPEKEAHGFTAQQIKRAAAAVRARLDRRPTRAEVAAELNDTEPTLYRAMKDLGMPRWPPGPPED
jgi:hypothetical protein